jgi:hypothetical protein
MSEGIHQMRRVITAALAAAALGAGLYAQAPAASAATVTQATPPTGYVVEGPGCPDVGYEGSHGSSGSWTTVSGYDYSGSDIYGEESSYSCSGKTSYAITASTQTAQFRWHFYDGLSYAYDEQTVCAVYAYIPTKYAGDHDARYDFWGDDGAGDLTWEAWPGQDLNQENMSGWYYIGTAVQPAGTYELTVSLSNADADYTGWDAGAGAVAAECVED